MWRFLTRFGNYFYQVIMPARFRRAALERGVTHTLESGVDHWQHPDQMAEMAANRAARGVEEQSAAQEAQMEGQAETGQAEIPGEPKASFGSRVLVVLRWMLHFLLLALVLVALWYLNWWLGLERILRSDWPWLHPYWLPLLFLILYVLLWLGGWLWSLTGPDRVGNDYPDLDQAWDLAVATLYRSGIDIRQAPVFLVLGRTESPPNELFGVTLRLRVSAPQGNVLPLRIFASQDRVFITCPGASVLARQARVLTQQSYDEAASQRNGEASANGTAIEGVARQTAAGESAIPGMETPVENAEMESTGTTPTTPDLSTEAEPQTAAVGVQEGAEPWTEEEQRVLGLLTTEGMGTGSRARKMTTTFLKDPAEVRLLTSRLQHLCRLIRRDRKPYCPINGILVLVPYSALEDDVDASHTGTACRYDLSVIRQTLQVQCPVFAMVSDMEKSEGFRQFLRRLPARHNISRLGQRFPLYPDVDDREIPRLVETGTTWLANSLLPSLVYNLFRMEGAASLRGPEVTTGEAVEENTRLYQFLWEMREQRRRLSRLLTRGLLLDMPRAFFFGGVYLAGTGRGASAFSTGVFLRLLQSQNFVSWTPQALTAEKRYRSWAWFLFIFNLILLISAPILAYVFWPW